MSVLGLILFSFSTVASPSAYLEFSDGQVSIKNLDEEVLYTFSRYNNSESEWKKVFLVTTSDSDVPMDGKYVVEKNTVRFMPRFPFVANIRYVARFYQDALAENYNEVYLPITSHETLYLSFEVASRASLPKVVEIYPTSNTLPENLLKFHIRFATSMTRGEIYDRVKLFEDGKLVEKAFLIVDEELWDDAMTAVTLMFDPGRIKRGLRGNVEMGAPLHAGRNYRLVIEEGWPDQFGNRTALAFEKFFRCSAADRERPKVEGWDIIPPTSSRGFLVVDMEESLDADLLSHSFRIKDEQGHIVIGVLQTHPESSVLIFTPDSAWEEKSYRIEFNPWLEDLAGNNLKTLFDEDNTMPAAPAITHRTFKVVLQTTVSVHRPQR